MGEEREEQMREKLGRLLGAPITQPITIDKGHAAPIYDDAPSPPRGRPREEEKRREEECRRRLEA